MSAPRISPRAGQGREFDRLRDYVTGDDYRNLSWKATARRGRPIMRDFRIDSVQRMRAIPSVPPYATMQRAIARELSTSKHGLSSPCSLHAKGGYRGE